MENFDKQKEEGILFAEIAEEINAMRDADQEMRKRALDNNGVIESEEDDTLDQRNTERMKEIIDQIGWPTVSKVGKKASTNAWLLVQHADHDVEFQKLCLSLMKEQIEGEVDQKDIAYLEDRVRVNTGQPQIYGTQFRWEGGNKPIQDIEDIENVDERRRVVGLNTLAENLGEIYENYKIEKPDS